MLHGRDEQQRALEELAVAVRAGRAQTLVITGEAGSGKTGLLHHLARRAAAAGPAPLLRVTGSEPERLLAFAGLHRLLMPHLGVIDRLPPEHRYALGRAFGLATGEAVGPDAVGAATLHLLQTLGAGLLCLVDDAHALDEESRHALLVAARRFGAEGPGLVFAARTDGPGAPPGRPSGWEGLPALALGGLGEAAARAVLDEVSGQRVDDAVVEALHTGTGGNPLALAELGASLGPDRLAGRTPLPDPLPVGPRLEQFFTRRARSLPPRARAVLVVAAAAAPDEPGPFRAACTTWGLRPDDARAAVVAGLLRVATAIVFPHPLVRAAVYSGATPAERRRAHAALAAAIEVPDGDVRTRARRAWHLAESAVGADELVADELERSAAVAPDLAGRAGRAALLARAAELTARPDARAARLLRAAEAQLAAGDPITAEALLGRVSGGSAAVSDRRERLRAAVRADPVRARRRLFDALALALVATPLMSGAGLAEIATAVLAVPAPASGLLGPLDLLLTGMALRIGGDVAGAVPLLRRSLDELEADAGHAALTDQQLVVSARAVDDLWPDEPWPRLESRLQAAGGAVERARHLESLAWRGREAETRAAAAQAIEDTGPRPGNVAPADTTHRSLTLLELSLGRYPEALAQARPLFRSDPPGLGNRVLPDLVEAAARAGDRPAAEAALTRLEERAVAAGTASARGLLARSRALLAPDGDAGDLFEEAGRHLGAGGSGPEFARTALLHGEWLRRRRRRSEARRRLGEALEAFETQGAALFAERTRNELRATGTAPGPAPGRTLLTAQEQRVAEMAAAGATNAQIASRLFVTASTVEFHLSGVYRKLGLRSRRELAGRIGPPDSPA